jgi:putative transposase
MRIGRTHPYYELLDKFCFASKNLYNQALYRIRQDFCPGKGYLNYHTIDASFKADNGLNNSDYKNMPTAASAQQTLLVLDRNWRSFFAATKQYKNKPESFSGKPKIPNYLDKEKGRQAVILPGQTVSVENGIIKFPKCFNGLEVKFRHDAQIRQIRFIPSRGFITVEVVYTVCVPEILPQNGRYFGIDLGINNFAAIASNVMAPVILSGAPLKAWNQYYNKLNAHYKAVETAMRPMVTYTGSTYCKQTNRLSSLTTKRNARVKDTLHKMSRYIVDLAVEYDVTCIVVGKNDGWKQEVRLGRRTNQQFVQLPHAQFISMLTYKAGAKGIEVIAHEESYTSKTSHVDGELPVKHEEYKGKRIRRGLFRVSDAREINADVNGAAQIMRKVFPVANAYGIVGGVNPVKVVVA